MPTSQRNRRGAAIVEVAMTAPILFMLVFASIEFSRANMLLHTAAISATEGARRGIVSGATVNDVKEAALAELQPLGISKARIIVRPGNIQKSTQMITVGVCIPLTTSNFFMTPKYFLGDEMIKVVSMTREAKSSKDSKDKAAAESAAVAADLANGLGQDLDSLLGNLPGNNGNNGNGNDGEGDDDNDDD